MDLVALRPVALCVKVDVEQDVLDDVDLAVPTHVAQIAALVLAVLAVLVTATLHVRCHAPMVVGKLVLVIAIVYAKEHAQVVVVTAIHHAKVVVVIVAVVVLHVTPNAIPTAQDVMQLVQDAEALAQENVKKVALVVVWLTARVAALDAITTVMELALLDAIAVPTLVDQLAMQVVQDAQVVPILVLLHVVVHVKQVVLDVLVVETTALLHVAALAKLAVLVVLVPVDQPVLETALEIVVQLVAHVLVHVNQTALGIVIQLVLVAQDVQTVQTVLQIVKQVANQLALLAQDVIQIAMPHVKTVARLLVQLHAQLHALQPAGDNQRKVKQIS